MKWLAAAFIMCCLSFSKVSTISRWYTTLVTKPQRMVNGQSVDLGGQARVLLFRSTYWESLHSRSHTLLYSNGVDSENRFWEEFINKKSSVTCPKYTFPVTVASMKKNGPMTECSTEWYQAYFHNKCWCACTWTCNCF